MAYASARLFSNCLRHARCLKYTAPANHAAASRLFSSSPRFSGRMLFSEQHEYLNITDNKAKLGITDHAQKELGDVVYVDLPEVEGQVLEAGDVACSVESVKAVADVYVSVSGKLLSTNSRLADDPGLVNVDPYTDGWLIEMEITDPKQLDKLMDEKAYEEYLLSVD